MSSAVVIHKRRENVITVNLGINITGDTITSEIRAAPEVTAPLIATFAVSIVEPLSGELTLTLSQAVAESIDADSGYMDVKRVTGGVAVPVFDKPLEVEFRGVVTE